MDESGRSQGQARDVRQKALQQELRELVDVVGPGPLVDLLLERAFQLRATDVHLDPSETGLRVRLRVDGILHDVVELPSQMTSHVISRLKLMANMDITERRLAQDGHITNAVLKQQRDVRLGSGPTIHGERIVLRLMPDSQVLNRVEDLGMEDDQVERTRDFLSRPSGLILSAGPVGSGKSTTMYACLEILNEPTRSLVTIEDPVERRIAGIAQIQVDPKIHFGFVEALRGVLRQDPDVVMVGEIRDPETAHIAVRAGLTGVTVLSTLHANDTAATIDVFREFGIPPMFIADSVQAIISQRLVRKICDHCRESYQPDESEGQLLGLKGKAVELARGRGCDACFQTGYLGRTGVFEIMAMDRELRGAILRDKPHEELMSVARKRGLHTLEERVRQKVLAGVTSVKEMHRVLASTLD